MRKAARIVLVSFLFLLASAQFAHAHCPLCTAAVGTGVVIARFYGVDDMVVGLWVGAFAISTALWASRMLKKRFIPFQGHVITAVALASTIVPLYFAGIIGNQAYTFFGIDKLLLGILIGAAVLPASVFASSWVKKVRGRVLFPFQTIVFVIAFLAGVSGGLWLIAVSAV